MKRSRIAIAALTLLAPFAPAQTFESDWPNTPNRTWIGPEYWANRLQDWRIADGTLECVENAPRFPLRTLMLLTRRAGPIPGSTQLSVRLTLPGAAPDDAFAGILLGAGSEHVDYRLSAQVHHRPAQDGGLIIGASPDGTLRIFDNSTGRAAGNGWSIAGPLANGELNELARSEPPESRPEPGDALTLEVRIDPEGETFRLGAALYGDRDDAISTLELGALTLDAVDGALGLVSHTAHARFDNWSIDGDTIIADDQRAWGPVLATQYTVSGNTLKLTAQTGPLGEHDTREARLEFEVGDDEWISAATATLQPGSCTFQFRVEEFDPSRETPFRVIYELADADGQTTTTAYEGLIRAEPDPNDPFLVASLNCMKIYTGGLRWNESGLWFPNTEIADALEHHDPDLLFFAGDQIYEGDLDPVDARDLDTLTLDYLNKWYRWCWSFHDLTRNRPTVTIPDDHDVYHGNIWGAGGKRAVETDTLTAQDSGGYKHPPAFVNAVHATQTSHLPDPKIPGPIGDGYSVYTTSFDYGPLSFAVLADRQFKSSAAVTVPDGTARNGWFQNPDFDPRDADTPESVLLGDTQEAFLRDWATDYGPGVWAKVLLSQSPFTNVATIPQNAASGSVIPLLPILEPGEYPPNYKMAADTDSNGWPQSGRNRAVEALRRGFAVHLAGDQHLATLLRYGLDRFGDSGLAFTSPAIGNTWPRRFFPPDHGLNPDPGAPAYTGDFLDGFGNKMTVYAVANPVRSGHEPANLYDRMPGYGLARFDPADRTVTFECWPRWTDPADPHAEQYPGWPRTFPVVDLAPHAAAGWLGPFMVIDAEQPVVRLIDETTGEPILAYRSASSMVRVPAPHAGPFTIELLDPETGRTRTIENMSPGVGRRFDPIPLRLEDGP